MPAPSGSISVLSFGATGDGATDDAPAIQAALDAAGAGDTVYVPAGDYRIGATLRVGESHGLSLVGAGPGSVLRLMDDCLRPILGVPVGPHDSSPTDYRPDGVTISRLTLDGNENGLGDLGDYFGIQVRQATNLTISKLHIKNLISDGITVSNGNMVTDGLLIEDCRISTRCNGIHVGFAVNWTLRGNYIENPDQWFGPSAGNAIDCEVEGYDLYNPPDRLPYVRSGLIEDNLISRREFLPDTGTSSTAVSLQPAYGPLSGVVVRRNVLASHQLAIETTGGLGDYGEAAGVHDIEIRDNWITAHPAAGYNVSGYPMSLLGCAHVISDGNVFNDQTGGSFSGAPGVTGAYDIAITNNTLRQADYAGTGLAHLYGVNDLVAITGNSYRTHDDTVYTDGSGTTNLTVAGNTSLSAEPWDVVGPTCSLTVAGGTTVSAPAAVTVTATDAGSAVARVFFFIDRIPWGHSDAAPHTFTFDPADHVDGDHILSAVAVDGSAALGLESSIAVTSSASAAATARILDEDGSLLLLESGGGLLTEAEAADPDPDPDPDPDLTGNVLLFSRPGGRVLMYSRAGVTP